MSYIITFDRPAARKAAKSLKSRLAKDGVAISLSLAYEGIAAALNEKDWNTLSAKVAAEPPVPSVLVLEARAERGLPLRKLRQSDHRLTAGGVPEWLSVALASAIDAAEIGRDRTGRAALIYLTGVMVPPADILDPSYGLAAIAHAIIARSPSGCGAFVQCVADPNALLGMRVVRLDLPEEACRQALVNAISDGIIKRPDHPNELELDPMVAAFRLWLEEHDEGVTELLDLDVRVALSF